ncbi:hypothetical protein BGZ96_007404 [Linnemannia gamsii]|uniref:Carboxypeptidase n=1 Tax=Linnemannia gamsii TaxID=64522 RepID=A0ABQ7KFR7_9FUNG|nr:hypothetical protein BGZ96_007404 [Linnemannia gamsii]
MLTMTLCDGYKTIQDNWSGNWIINRHGDRDDSPNGIPFRPPSIDYLAFLKRLRVNYYTHGEEDFPLSLRKFCQSLGAEERANSPHAALYEHLVTWGFSSISDVRRTHDILLMDLAWALCNERLEQLQSLSIYLEEIDRYLAVVDRLPLLSRVCFEQGTEDFNAKSEAEKEMIWQGMLSFVERHTLLFGTLREIDYPACPQSMRWQLWRALPVVLDPRRIDATNWLQFHAQTDRTRLDHVTSIQIPATCFPLLQGYLKTMEQSEPYLHRCRGLQRYEMPFLGADVDSFEWAAKEKLDAGYTRQDPNTATSTTMLPLISSLSLSDLQRPSHRSRVMVKHVKVQANIEVMDGWLENVAFAFSESLETFSIRDDVSNPQLGSALVTHWNLPHLRKLEMQSRQRSLHFDTGMLVHSPLLEDLVLRDHVAYLNDFEWDAVVLQEPLRLPKLQILRLKGIPAITFHPHSFLNVHGIDGQSNDDGSSSNNHDDYPGMPNLHTLSLNVNGSMDSLPTTALTQHTFPPLPWMTVERETSDADGTIPAVWSQLRDRSFWNWTWNMPQLTVLELRGEFALYFDLDMLKRTPALEVLSLDIWSRFLPRSAQTRTLDLSELMVAGKEQQQKSEVVKASEELQKEQQELLVLPRLTHLHLEGPWVINGPTLKSLFTRVMPNLIWISECGCRGFNFREWMEATVQLEHLLSSNMYTMTTQDVPLKVIEQYELKAAGDRSNMESLKNELLKINETMEMSILANRWPGPRRQHECSNSMRSTLRKKVTLWTILVLSASIVLFTHANRNAGRQSLQSVLLKRGPFNAEEQDAGAKAKAIKMKREEHLVGDLPWAEGQEPIPSYAGHIPIRKWHQSEYHGETGMFYWFFPAVKPQAPNPPLLFWFQGGPGSSSMIGQFFGNGPIYLTANNTLARRETHWADEYSIVFIDQPVGTGYSYVTRLQDNTGEEEVEPIEGNPPAPASSSETTDANNNGEEQQEKIDDQVLVDLHDELLRDQYEEQEIFAQLVDQDISTKMEHIRLKRSEKKTALYWKGYVKDERGVAADLLNFMDQFYTRYPEQKKADLFLTGESYAGKYVPSLAYAILESNQGHRHRYRHISDNDSDKHDQIIFPLKGIALGNSLTEPIKQVGIHSDHAYFSGLASRAQAKHMKRLQDEAVKEAQLGRFLASNQYRVDLFDYLKNVTGGINWYDIRKGGIPNDWSRMDTFLNRPEIKDALNVYGPRLAYLEQTGVSKKEIKRITEGRAKTKFFKDPLVIKTMEGDIMKPAAWMVSELLRQGIRVVAYQGIFDFRDGVAGSESWLEDLDWEGSQNFTNADRQIWIDGGNLAGYVTQVPGLAGVVVLGAGHIAPMDHPKSVKAVIKSLVEGSELEVSNSVEPVQHTI